MVEFFKTSIACKAIKYILSQTALPLYKTITSDEFIFEGCTYVYKDKLIKCTKSGRFDGLNSSLDYDDHLYTNDHLTVSDDFGYVQRRGQEREPIGTLDVWSTEGTRTPLGNFIPSAIPTGIGKLSDTYSNTTYYDDYITVTDDVVKQFLRPFAEVEILQDFHFGEFTPGLSYYYQANSNYYDTETHYYLGEYLRCLRDIVGIDLMCLYNCFTYKYVDNVSINVNDNDDIPTYLTEECLSNKKVTLVPIKFNKPYTIATSCPFKIEVKSIFYKDTLMKDLNNDKYICEQLFESYKSFNNIQFEQPRLYEITTDNPQLLQYEKYLYLAIQLPSNHNEPIVVLEGDYTKHADKQICDVVAIQNVSEKQLSRVFKSNLSLLINDGRQKPFADTLLEYLFENTIDLREYIDENITHIENCVNYIPQYRGHWSTTLRYILYTKYMELSSKLTDKTDVLGFVDSKMETMVNKGLIRNAK